MSDFRHVASRHKTRSIHYCIFGNVLNTVKRRSGHHHTFKKRFNIWTSSLFPSWIWHTVKNLPGRCLKARDMFQIPSYLRWYSYGFLWASGLLWSNLFRGRSGIVAGGWNVISHKGREPQSSAKELQILSTFRASTISSRPDTVLAFQLQQEGINAR